MKRIIIILFAISFLLPTANGQLWKSKRWETSIGAGPTLFFGDIGGFSLDENVLGLKDISFQQTRYNVDFNIKYRIVNNFNVRTRLDFGVLHASDKRGSNEGRGYIATNYYVEPMALGEFYFIKNKVENSFLFLRNRDNFVRNIIKSFDFYVFSGSGAHFYNIKGNEKFITLGIKKDKGATVVLPLGVGTNYYISPSFNIGAEVCGRYAFSDYLDGYTSQYSKRNDVYYTLNLTVTYKFTTNSRGGITFR